jgi:hypothetical protein
MEIQDIPSYLLTEAVREIVKEVHSVYLSLSNLREFESDSPHYEVECQALRCELDDLQEDLELELTIARSFVRGFKRKRKAATAQDAPVTVE